MLNMESVVIMAQHDPNTVRLKRQPNNLFDTHCPSQVHAVMDERAYAQAMTAINAQAATFNPNSYKSLMGKLAIGGALFFFALFAVMGPVAGNLFINSSGGFNPMILMAPIAILFIGTPVAVNFYAQKRLQVELAALHAVCQSQSRPGVSFSAEGVASGIVRGRRGSVTTYEDMLVIRVDARASFNSSLPLRQPEAIPVQGVYASSSAPVTVQGTVVTQPIEPAPPASVPEQMAQLAALRQQGVLSDSEFEAAKARVLNATV